MRKDVFTGHWVIMAETETVGPADFQFKPFTRAGGFCPFCETNESSTPPEVFAIRRSGSLPNQPGWHVRVVPNNKPRGKTMRAADEFRESGTRNFNRFADECYTAPDEHYDVMVAEP
jgi:galactose-1-phosphate uridylyltransferase